jgi:hypothetical protein
MGLPFVSAVCPTEVKTHFMSPSGSEARKYNFTVSPQFTSGERKAFSKTGGDPDPFGTVAHPAIPKITTTIQKIFFSISSLLHEL